jgi:predicted kinase
VTDPYGVKTLGLFDGDTFHVLMRWHVVGAMASEPTQPWKFEPYVGERIDIAYQRDKRDVEHEVAAMGLHETTLGGLHNQDEVESVHPAGWQELLRRHYERAPAPPAAFDSPSRPQAPASPEGPAAGPGIVPRLDTAGFGSWPSEEEIEAHGNGLWLIRQKGEMAPGQIRSMALGRFGKEEGRTVWWSGGNFSHREHMSAWTFCPIDDNGDKLDAAPVLRGEDARRLVEQLGQVAPPEKIARHREEARRRLAENEAAGKSKKVQRRRLNVCFLCGGKDLGCKCNFSVACWGCNPKVGLGSCGHTSVEIGHCGSCHGQDLPKPSGAWRVASPYPKSEDIANLAKEFAKQMGELDDAAEPYECSCGHDALIHETKEPEPGGSPCLVDECDCATLRLSEGDAKRLTEQAKDMLNLRPLAKADRYPRCDEYPKCPPGVALAGFEEVSKAPEQIEYDRCPVCGHVRLSHGAIGCRHVKLTDGRQCDCKLSGYSVQKLGKEIQVDGVKDEHTPLALGRKEAQRPDPKQPNFHVELNETFAKVTKVRTKMIVDAMGSLVATQRVLSTLPARSPDHRVLVVLRGLPGSGKSTVAQAIVDSDPARWVRVSKDDLRQMMVGPSGDLFRFVEDRDREKLVGEVVSNLIVEALVAGLDVVLDTTNLTQRQVERVRNIADQASWEGGSGDRSTRMPVLVCERAIDTPLEDCIARDKLRGKRSVGEAVIRRLAATIDLPLANRDWEAGS